jgi:hypothetical protein
MLLSSAAENRRIPFVENLDDPVIIDGFSALGDFITTDRTGGDIFGQQLAAALT